MNIKTLIVPTIYTSLVIATTCIAFYGGFQSHLNTVAIFGWLFLLPFCLFQIYFVRKTVYNNVIGGRDATKEGLMFVMLSTVALVIFQSIFFYTGFRDYKINFMQTQGFELAKLQIASGSLKIKDSEIPGLIQEEIKGITIGKEITSIVFRNLFLGIFASFIGGVFFKFKSVTGK